MKKKKAQKIETEKIEGQAAYEQDSEGYWREKFDWLSVYLEKAKFADYMTLLQKPRRMIWLNLLSGAARGFGFAVGFTILGALVIYLINQLNILDLPLIGDFISDLITYIESNQSPGI